MARKRDAKGSGSSRSGARPARSGSQPAPPAGSSSSSTVRPSISRPAQGLGSQRQAAPRSSQRSRQQVIPDAVANRMARRIAIATGIPTLMGMGVFIGSYLLVSRSIVDIAPSATLLASGVCFLLGLLGLSYGVLSSSWEDTPGSLLGSEQIGLNIARMRASIQAMRQGSGGGSGN